MNKLVSFKLAGLLEKSGYSIPTYDYYILPRGVGFSKAKINHNGFSYKSMRYSAPSIGEVIKWLWEDFYIWIVIDRDFDSFLISSIREYNSLKGCNDNIDLKGLKKRDFLTFEEAYEVAIEHYLTNKK